MTFRERIMNTVAGKPSDQLPFIPRLDLWYKANVLGGTLPDKYKNASLMEIVDGLDVGYHCLLPDFSRLEYENADADIGLGVYHLDVNCYETVFHNVEKTVERDGKGTVRTTYRTPKGNITTTCVLDQKMVASGITLWVIKEHAIKSEDDWEAIAYIFENAEILPRYDRLEQFQQFVGERAEAVAYAHTQACAMHLLIKDLMPLDEFCYAMYDDNEALEQLGARIEPYMTQLFDVVSKAPSRLVFSGGNFDVATTAPSIYRPYILPQVKIRADKCHAMGKYLICHTDGENNGLMPELMESGFDIADSICPAPMTQLDLSDYLREFRGKKTIWGAIPSIVMLENSMDDKTFYRYIDDLFTKLGDGRGVILSIADTTPPDAKFERIELIARLAKEFGPVK
ncbi:MAG: hypothetical protein E7487_09125 [Ruminococcaceae bacterium]|nr:hypothetical protein [Oscillospiraceae bacterium]